MVSTERIAYILYPMDTLKEWIEPAAQRYGITIVAISGMDWQNVFSPWPATGVPAGTEDFKGESPQFLDLLQNSLVPKIDKTLKINETVERTLVGVSMSGLFALWQWPQTSMFKNILCLSGSFWYEGFMDWFEKQNFKNKDGYAFFLLGMKEPKTRVTGFASVGENTESIVNTLKNDGVRVQFQWVPGNHLQHPIERLDIAFQTLDSRE